MSSKNYFIIERKVRKRRLLEMIQKNPDLTPGKLKGLFSTMTGMSFKKIDLYLSELEESELIEIGEEHIRALVSENPVKAVKD